MTDFLSFETETGDDLVLDFDAEAASGENIRTDRTRNFGVVKNKKASAKNSKNSSST